MASLSVQFNSRDANKMFSCVMILQCKKLALSGLSLQLSDFALIDIFICFWHEDENLHILKQILIKPRDVLKMSCCVKTWYVLVSNRTGLWSVWARRSLCASRRRWRVSSGTQRSCVAGTASPWGGRCRARPTASSTVSMKSARPNWGNCSCSAAGCLTFNTVCLCASVR